MVDDIRIRSPRRQIILRFDAFTPHRLALDVRFAVAHATPLYQGYTYVWDNTQQKWTLSPWDSVDTTHPIFREVDPVVRKYLAEHADFVRSQAIAALRKNAAAHERRHRENLAAIQKTIASLERSAARRAA
jgi:hypothetical protein